MKLTPEEVLATAKINPELEQIFIQKPWTEFLHADSNLPSVRAAILKHQQALKSKIEPPAAEPTYVETDIQIPARDGTTITARIHKPRVAPEDGCPVFVVYHGGGFCLGTRDDLSRLCRAFVELGGVTVNVEYRLAPEHSFPVPVEDALDALRWTAAHCTDLGGNPKKGFLVGGISAGANIASILALIARDENLSPPLTGCYLSILPIGASELVPERYNEVFLSREQNHDAPILNTTVMKLFNKNYNPITTSPLWSPLNLAYTTHKGLPRTYFQVCGMDPLRDDAFVYERILSEESGVDTKVDVYPGLPHAFWSVWTEAEFTKAFWRDEVEGLRWLLRVGG